MTSEKPAADWPRLLGHVRTAERLAPLGGRPSDEPAPLPARAWSRLRSALGLLLTARQKRFNREAIAALDELAGTVLALQTEVADLRAELAALRTDLEPPHFRPGTLDANIWADVNRHNEYRLPDVFAPADLILDVGAHIGSFSFACLRRGAGAVVAYEPDPDNYPLACLNLARFGPRARVVRAAAWRSDVPAGRVQLFRSLDPANTGGGGVVGTGEGTADAVPFDEAVADALARTGAARVRLLKLDCEGSEYPILLTSRSLHLIDAVCGEYHESGWPAPEHARVGGHDRYDRHTLRRCLEGHGFRVETRQHTPNPEVGLFFATRPAA